MTSARLGTADNSDADTKEAFLLLLLNGMSFSSGVSLARTAAKVTHAMSAFLTDKWCYVEGVMHNMDYMQHAYTLNEHSNCRP